MQHNRESRGIRQFIKQRKEEAKEAEKVKQAKIAEEIRYNREITDNLTYAIWRLFAIHGLIDGYLFQVKLKTYWKQNRKINNL